MWCPTLSDICHSHTLLLHSDMRSKRVAPFHNPVVRNLLTVHSNWNSSFQAGHSKCDLRYPVCHQGLDPKLSPK